MANDPHAGAARRLGEYLNCREPDIERALAEQSFQAAQTRQPLGELLLEAGVLAHADLEAGLLAQRADRLGSCRLFAGLDSDSLLELAGYCRELTLEPGATLIEQDSRDTNFYLLARGRVQVYRNDEAGHEVAISVLEDGAPIGEMAYFSDGVRSASVRVLARSECLVLPYEVLADAFDTYPPLASAFLKVATRRLRDTSVLYQETQLKRVSAERTLGQLTDFLDPIDSRALQSGIEGLIDRVVRTASRVMQADRASLFLLDNTTGDLWSKVAEGAGSREIRVPAGTGVVGWVAQHREMVNIADAYADARFSHDVDKRTGYRTRAILCGPVWGLENELLGVVQVINREDGQAFDNQDELLFRAFAHQAAVAVENFNLYRQVMRSHERMAILLDIANSVGGTLEIGPMINGIVGRITDALDCDRAAFFVYDEDVGELWSMQAVGSELKEIRFPAHAGLAGHTALTGRTLNIADAYQDERFNAGIDKRTGYRTRSVLCVAACNRAGDVVGVTQAINKRGGPFERDDVDLLAAISSQIAVALQNAQLYARTVGMKNYLNSVQESISNGIITLDDQLQIVTCNRAACDLLGWQPGAALPLSQLVGEQGKALTELGLAVIEYRQAGSADEVELAGKDDNAHTVNATAFPLYDEESASHNGLVLVLEDLTQEKRVRSTLTRYMAKDIVERMLTDPSHQALGGVRGRATVLFSDIQGFTAISEQLTAEQTLDFLNEYFGRMVDEVFSHQGVLDKFLGDGLMAVFGIPYAQEDDATRAVATALAMVEALNAYNIQREARGEPPVGMGVGINTGEVISGNMGSEKRMDYTVIGDTVNVSSRVEGLTRQYGVKVLISDSTRAAVEDSFTLLEIDSVIVKGRSAPMGVHAVLGPLERGLTAAERSYGKALADYRAGRFAMALDRLAAIPDMGPARLLEARCRDLLESPPADAWSGVWRATRK